MRGSAPLRSGWRDGALRVPSRRHGRVPRAIPSCTVLPLSFWNVKSQGCWSDTARFLAVSRSICRNELSGVYRCDEHAVLQLASLDVVVIERSAGNAGRIIPRAYSPGRGGDGHSGVAQGRIDNSDPNAGTPAMSDEAMRHGRPVSPDLQDFGVEPVGFRPPVLRDTATLFG